MIIKFKTVNIVCFITLAIITVLLGASVIFYIIMQIDDILAIHHSHISIPARIMAFFGLIIGGLLYALMVQIINRFFSKEVSMEFNPEYLNIRSGNNDKVIKYTEIKNYIVRNNTDYAKIIVETNTGKYTFHIGLANLNLLKWNRFKIIDSFDEIDAYFVDFEKIICEKKGMESVRYENKKLSPYIKS
jgi:hypothetical protein